MIKRWMPLLVIIGLIIITGLSLGGVYNRMVAAEEHVRTTFSNMDVQYQRRADLIPNLVEVVKGYAAHEKDVFVEVTNARAKVGQIQIGNNLSLQRLQEYINAQDALTQALSRLMVVVEQYPQLKADQNFRELQAQLEGTENRIAFARNQYNEAVRGYNTLIRRFPNNLIASMFSFGPYPYYEAEVGTQQAPKVKF